MSTKDMMIYNSLDLISEKLRQGLIIFDKLVQDWECPLNDDILEVGKMLTKIYEKASYEKNSIGFQVLPNAEEVHKMIDIDEFNNYTLKPVLNRLEERINLNVEHKEAIFTQRLC